MNQQEVIAEVAARLSKMKTDRKPWEEVWSEIIDALFPALSGSWENKNASRGKRTGSNIYDTYPLLMLNTMADGIQGHMVSDAFRWFSLYMPKETMQRDPLVKRWVQDVEDQMYYEFQRSNFYEAINEYIQDAGAIGTATIYAQENIDATRISFKVMHPREVWLAENFDGRVDTHVREFYLSAKKAHEKWGDYCDAVAWSRKNEPLSEFRFVHTVFPRGEFMPGSKSPKDRPYASLYIDMDNNVVVSESGYQVNPYATWRWRKMSHEVYGRGPTWEILRDIKALNEISKTLLMAGQRHANPLMFVPAEMRGQFDRRAGALTYYQDANRVPFQLTERSNFPIGQDRENQKRAIIREAFKVDFFLMLQQSEREMTATEIIEKQNEKVAILGAVIGRFQSEALNPIIDIVFNTALEAGRLPEPPEVITSEFGGEPIDIDYTGPLAQAQKRLKVQGTQAALNAILPYSQIDPSVLDPFKLDVVAQEIAEAYGMRQDAIRTAEEVQKLRQDRARQQQVSQQVEMAEKMGRTVRDASQAMPQSELSKLFGNTPNE